MTVRVEPSAYSPRVVLLRGGSLWCRSSSNGSQIYRSRSATCRLCFSCSARLASICRAAWLTGRLRSSLASARSSAAWFFASRAAPYGAARPCLAHLRPDRPGVLARHALDSGQVGGAVCLSLHRQRLGNLGADTLGLILSTPEQVCLLVVLGLCVPHVEHRTWRALSPPLRCLFCSFGLSGEACQFLGVRREALVDREEV